METFHVLHHQWEKMHGLSLGFSMDYFFPQELLTNCGTTRRGPGVLRTSVAGADPGGVYHAGHGGPNMASSAKQVRSHQGAVYFWDSRGTI